MLREVPVCPHPVVIPAVLVRMLVSKELGRSASECAIVVMPDRLVQEKRRPASLDGIGTTKVILEIKNPAQKCAVRTVFASPGGMGGVPEPVQFDQAFCKFVVVKFHDMWRKVEGHQNAILVCIAKWVLLELFVLNLAVNQPTGFHLSDLARLGHPGIPNDLNLVLREKHASAATDAGRLQIKHSKILAARAQNHIDLCGKQHVRFRVHMLHAEWEIHWRRATGEWTEVVRKLIGLFEVSQDGGLFDLLEEKHNSGHGHLERPLFDAEKIPATTRTEFIQ